MIFNIIQRIPRILATHPLASAAAFALWLMLFAGISAPAQLSWSPVINGMDGAFIDRLYFDKTGAPVAGTWSGIYHYEAGRWRKAAPKLIPREFWHTPAGTLLAIAYDGVSPVVKHLYRYSSDAGVWQKMRDSVKASNFVVNRDGSISLLSSEQGLRSTDDGITWIPIQTRMPENGWGLYRSSTGAWFCMDAFRVFRSEDEGGTWIQTGTLSPYAGISMWLPDGRLLSSIRGGIQISTDQGATWESRTTMEQIRSFAVHPGGALLAYRDSHTKAGADSNGLYISTDEGITWSRIFEGLIRSYGVMPDGSILLNQGRDLFRSTDVGATWAIRNEGLMYGRIEQFQIDRAGRLYTLLWGDGYPNDSYPHPYYTLYQSDNHGASWRKIKDSLSSEMLMIDSADNIYVAEHRLTDLPLTKRYRTWLARSTDLGTTWMPLNGDSSIVSVAFNRKGVMVAGSVENDTIIRLTVSTDSGNTWRKANFLYTSKSLWQLMEISGFQTAMVSPAGALFATRPIGSGNPDAGLYRSGDFGATWKRVDTAIVVRANKFGITSWGGLLAPPAITNGNPDNSDRKVMRSLDNGLTWHMISGFTSLHRFSFAPNGHIYAEGGGKMPTVRSTSGGSAWEKVVTGLPDNTAVQELVFTPRGEICGIVNGRPYISIDDGISWNLADDGIPDHPVKFMAAAPNGYLFAATQDLGVFVSTKLQGIDDDAEHQGAPASALHEPLPNPSDGDVTLSFTLEQPSPVTLHIHDLMGREVAGPLYQQAASGRNEFQLDISGLATGSYIVSLRAGGTTSTRRLLRR